MKVLCPGCRTPHAINMDGTIRRHENTKQAVCKGSGRQVEEPRERPTRRGTNNLRGSWRTGILS